MRKRHIVIGIIVLVALNVGAFLVLRGLYEHNDSSIRQALAEYKAVDEQKTADMVSNVLRDIKVIQGPAGASIQGDPGNNGTNGKDGKAGEQGPKGDTGASGKDGKDGKNARQIVIDTDPLTGDIMWKYADDTLWTLLVEKCELKGVCQ